MPIYDLLRIVLGLAALLWLFVGVLRYGLRCGAGWRVSTGATLVGLSAMVTLLLGGAHLVAVLARPLQGRGLEGAAEFEYTFFFYSVVLLGVVLVMPALFLARSTRGVVRGERAAWRVAFWASVILLAVNVPLIPLQPFAPLLSAVAALGLMGLAAARPRKT